MREGHIRVHVTFKLPTPENANAFATLFREAFIARTRQEDGCILYDVWQANDDPLTLILIEEWASQKALDTHLAQDWLQEQFPKAKALLGEGDEPTFHFCTSVTDAQ